jgi:predicted phosphodiesterase
MARVGIIGDTHIPYHLDGYMEFCKETFDAWGVDTVVHIGDLIDHHALSFHDSEPLLKGAHGELLDAREELKPWFDTFPELILVNGNHDLIPARQLKKIGMEAEVWMRPLGEIYGFPEGWEIVDDIEIDDVLYHHGHTSVGVNGFRNDAKARMCNTVSGHAHGNAGVSYTACHHRLVFGMATGCGVDNKQMAFAYGKHFKWKPIVSCGVVIDGKLPVVETMDLGEW